MNKYLKLIHIILLFLIGFILIFWSFFNTIITLDIKQMIGVTIGIFTSLILIYENKYFKKSDIKHKDLVKAIQECIHQNENINTIRIFALTTYIVQPVIKTLDKNINKCKILVYEPNQEAPNSFTEDYMKNLDVIIKEWKYLNHQQKINNLDIKKYCFIPTNYYIIFNEKNLILGNFLLNDERYPFCETQEPIVFSNSDSTNKVLIEKYINLFDSIFNSEKSIEA